MRRWGPWEGRGVSIALASCLVAAGFAAASGSSTIEHVGQIVDGSRTLELYQANFTDVDVSSTAGFTYGQSGCLTSGEATSASLRLRIAKQCSSAYTGSVAEAHIAVLGGDRQRTPMCGPTGLAECLSNGFVVKLRGLWSGSVKASAYEPSGALIDEVQIPFPVDGYSDLYGLIYTSIAEDFTMAVRVVDATGAEVDVLARPVTVVPSAPDAWLQSAEFAWWEDEYFHVALATLQPRVAACLETVSADDAVLNRVRATNPIDDISNHGPSESAPSYARLNTAVPPATPDCSGEGITLDYVQLVGDGSGGGGSGGGPIKDPYVVLT